MNLKAKALRGSAVLTAGEGISYGASFIRNMILARILTRADFGIAATFAMVITLLEFSAKLGVARFVVREKEADHPEFIAAAHVVQFGAAILSALIIAAAAWPVSLLFGLREHVTAFLCLAAIPLVLGLIHLDTRRFERELRFGPSAFVDTIPQVVVTLLAYPLGVWLGDYRVVLVLLILKVVLTTAGSHVLAERPYQWRVRRDYTVRMLRFGWPLVVTGFLTFFVVRGDQFVVATFYAMSDLGAYAAAASLTLVPTLVFTRVFAGVMLPVMAKVQDDAVAFERRYRQIIAFVSAFSAAYAVTLAIGAESLMRLAFGPKYQGAGIILACLAGANAFRNLRLATTIAAMAKGDSVNQMISNFWGTTSLLPALAVAVAGRPVWMVALSGLLGELLAGSASILRLRRRDGVPLARSLVPASLVFVTVALGWMTCLLISAHKMPSWVSLPMAVVAGCLAASLVIVTLRDSRREASHFLRQLRVSGWRNPLSWLKGSFTPRKSVES